MEIIQVINLKTKKTLSIVIIFSLIVSTCCFLFESQEFSTSNNSANFSTEYFFNDRSQTYDIKNTIMNKSLIIESDEDLSAFPGSGTKNDPFIIEYYNIITENSSGIYISGTTKSILIKNCYIDAGEIGISLNNIISGNVTIYNNSLVNNFKGIYVNSSYKIVDIEIVNNYCSKNYYGVYIEDSPSISLKDNICKENNKAGIFSRNSNNISIINNLCTYNFGEGIYIYNSSNAKISRNTCNSNSNNGLFISDSFETLIYDNLCMTNKERGILLQFSSLSRLINNTLWGNQADGIKYFKSDKCISTFNYLLWNLYYGIRLEYGTENSFFFNSFIKNNNQGIQGYDNGFENKWSNYSINKGNYWYDLNNRSYYALDGISKSANWWEIVNSFNMNLNDSSLDVDDDGLTNLQEYLYNTNPRNNDTDNDGMPDGWEMDSGLSPIYYYDYLMDDDSDFLINLDEYLNGTDPQNNDTDNDGYLDGVEVYYSTDPLDATSFPEDFNSETVKTKYISIVNIILVTSFFGWYKKRRTDKR